MQAVQLCGYSNDPANSGTKWFVAMLDDAVPEVVETEAVVEEVVEEAVTAPQTFDAGVIAAVAAVVSAAGYVVSKKR